MANDSIDFLFNEVAAKTIKKYREKKGMSLEEVVSKMKSPISRQALFKYENNQARMKNSTFIEICEVLGLDPKIVFREINDKSRNLAGRISEISKTPNFFDVFDENGNKETMVAIANDEIQNDFYSNYDNYIKGNEINEKYRNDNIIKHYKALLKEDDRLTDEQKNFLANFLDDNSLNIKNDNPTNELDILYNKAKDLLNDTEYDMVKHSMQRAIDRYEEQKKNGN